MNISEYLRKIFDYIIIIFILQYLIKFAIIIFLFKKRETLLKQGANSSIIVK